MYLPTTLLLVLAIGASVQHTDDEAVEVAHNFIKGFVKSIQTGDVAKVNAWISPGVTDIDASKLIENLKGLRPSFRYVWFVNGNKNEINISAVFRKPGTEKATLMSEVVIESKAANSWTIKSWKDVPKPAARQGFLPPLVMG